MNIGSGTIAIVATTTIFAIFLLYGRHQQKHNPVAQKMLEMAVHGVEPPEEWIEEITRPSGTHIIMTRSDNRVEFKVPSIGLNQGSGDNVELGNLGIMCLGLLFLAVSIFSVFEDGSAAFQSTQDYIFVIGGSLLFLGPFLNCFKSATIIAEGDYLSINYRGAFGTKRGRWHRSQIEGIWAEEWPSGIWSAKRGEHPSDQDYLVNPPVTKTMLDVMGSGDSTGWYDCMYVMPKADSPFVFLVGWEIEELLWIRKELLEQLDLQTQSSEEV